MLRAGAETGAGRSLAAERRLEGSDRGLLQVYGRRLQSASDLAAQPVGGEIFASGHGVHVVHLDAAQDAAGVKPDTSIRPAIHMIASSTI